MDSGASFGTSAGQVDTYENTSVIIQGSAEQDIYVFQNLQAGDLLGITVRGVDLDFDVTSLSGQKLAVGPNPAPNGYLPFPLSEDDGIYTTGVVIREDDTHFVTISNLVQSAVYGAYEVEFNVVRAGLWDQPVGNKQILYLDFDGAFVTPSDFASFGDVDQQVYFPAMSVYLSNWGLASTDEEALIRKIEAVVKENLQDIAQVGPNGDFELTGHHGEFGFKVLTSLDVPDINGLPNVSTMIFGGSNVEIISTGASLSTGPWVGTSPAAESSPGNTRQGGEGIIFAGGDVQGAINNLSGAPGASDPTAMIELVGRTLANYASHEFGHMLGLHHALGNPAIYDGPNLMNESMVASAELGADGIFGTSDDAAADLDWVSAQEPRYWYWWGLGAPVNQIADLSWNLSTGTTHDDGLPRVNSVSIAGPNERDGISGKYNFPAGSGDQLLAAPIGGASDIYLSISSSDEFALDGDLLVLENVAADADPNASVYSAAEGNLEYLGVVENLGHWRITDGNGNRAPLKQGQYVLTLPSVAVTSGGNELDGEWDNPQTLTDLGTSTFPSGDGVEGGDFEFYFTYLPGDFEQTSPRNLVDIIDYGRYADHYLTGVDYSTGELSGIGPNDVVDFGIFNDSFQLDYRIFPLDDGGAALASYGSPLMEEAAIRSVSPTSMSPTGDLSRERLFRSSSHSAKSIAADRPTATRDAFDSFFDSLGRSSKSKLPLRYLADLGGMNSSPQSRLDTLGEFTTSALETASLL